MIFHVGANDLNSWKNGELVETSITDLAKSLANDKRKITTPGIFTRNDKWSNKISK